MVVQVLVDVLDDSDVVASPMDNAPEIVFDVVVRPVGIAPEIDSDAAVHPVDIAPEIDSDVAVSPVDIAPEIDPVPLSVLRSLPKRSMTRNSWSH